MDAVVEEERVGVIVRELNRDAYLNALNEAEALRREPGTAERCRAAAVRRFDLKGVGGARYLNLYRRVLARRAGGM